MELSVSNKSFLYFIPAEALTQYPVQEVRPDALAHICRFSFAGGHILSADIQSGRLRSGNRLLPMPQWRCIAFLKAVEVLAFSYYLPSDSQFLSTMFRNGSEQQRIACKAGGSVVCVLNSNNVS